MFNLYGFAYLMFHMEEWEWEEIKADEAAIVANIADGIYAPHGLVSVNVSSDIQSIWVW